MHRNHRPDCHKAYLQLSHFKKQPASGVATSRSNQQQTKNRNSKKQRVDSSGNASSTPLLAQEDFNKETLNSFPHREMYHTNSSSGLLSVTGNTAAPNSDSEDNNSNQNSSFMELLVEEPSSGVESVEDTEGEDATTGNATDDDTPDTSLLKLYNDINSVLYSNDELPLNKFSIQEKVQVDLLRTLKRLKAPLKTFHEVLNWSERAKCAGYRFTEGKPTRKQLLLAELQAMTHLKDFQPQTKKLQLPHSKQTVEIVYLNAKAVMTSLLSSPTSR
jgi:hypothetical protein